MTRLLYSRYWPATQAILPVGALVLYGLGMVAAAKLFSSIDDLYLRYALACVALQTAALLILAAGLIGGKLIAVRRNERLRRTRDRIGDLIAQYSCGAHRERELIAAARVHTSEFLEVWEASLTALKGPSRLRVEELLTRTGLDRRLMTQLADRDPGQVLRAIALLRKLESPPMGAIEKALGHPTEVVRTAARITIAARGCSESQNRVLDQLPSLPFWQRVVLFQQIPADSPALHDYLARAFLTGDDTAVLAALEFVLCSQRLQPVSRAGRLASSPSVEVRIKFFKALPFLATDENIATLICKGLDDPDWRARAMTARACGILRIAPLGSELARRLLRATHPVEASHLARALAALGGDSLRRLHEFTIAENEMTRAVAIEVIEKHLTHAQEQVR